MPRFRIQAIVAIEPDAFQDIDDADGAVYDDTRTALLGFVDHLEQLTVEEVAG